MAIAYNMSLDQGSDFFQEFAVDDNLATVTVVGKMRRHWGSANAVAFTTTANNNSGVISIALNYTQTANLTPGNWVYDVVVFDTTANTRTRVAEGLISINPSASY
jgi:hypothetical protein